MNHSEGLVATVCGCSHPQPSPMFRAQGLSSWSPGSYLTICSTGSSLLHKMHSSFYESAFLPFLFCAEVYLPLESSGKQKDKHPCMCWPQSEDQAPARQRMHPWKGVPSPPSHPAVLSRLQGAFSLWVWKCAIVRGKHDENWTFNCVDTNKKIASQQKIWKST